MGGPAYQAWPSMTMTRVDSIADGRGWLEDLKDFAVARGWNNDDYQTDVQWGWDGGQYDWIAGTGDFLQISSTGYGSQKLRYRFYAIAGTGEHIVTWNLVHPSYNAVDNAKSTLPYKTTDHHCVSEAVYMQDMSLPNSTFPGSWFIGNDRFIAWEAECVTSSVLVSGAIGTFDLMLEYQNIANELACRWPGFYRHPATKYSDWETSPEAFTAPNALLGSAQNADYIIYWAAQGCAGSGTDNSYLKYATTCCPYSGDEPTSWSNSQFGRDNYIVKYGANAYSNKRVLVKPKILLRDSDGKWMPAGTMPLYNLPYQGLSMGDQITYGGRTFICFPNGIGTNSYGHCYDIT